MTRHEHRFLKKISLSFSVFFVILLITAVCCGLISVYMIYYNRTHLLDETQSNLENYIGRIANQMEITDYMTESNNDIDSEFEYVCDVLNGRILVVDRYQNVIFDSYYKDGGMTLLSGNIANAVNGQESTVLDTEAEEAKLYFPIIPSGKSESIGAALVVVSVSDIWQSFLVQKKQILLMDLLIIFVVSIVALIFALRSVEPFRKLRASLVKVRDDNSADIPSESKNREVYQLSSLSNELLHKNQHLEESRQQFVSNVSHELKTPMTSMQVLAESILSMPDPPMDTVLEFLSDIDHEITRENAIISDILTLVSFDQKVNVLHAERKNINELMEIVLKRIRPLAESRGIEVILENYRPVTAAVDEAKMIVALSDLAENAVKYNRDNGFIHCIVNADLHYFYISIEDSGIGMNDEDVKHIFDRFYRVDKARSRESGGTGLGLSIAKEIITMHNGSIKVYSKENVGTTMMIRIPLNLAESVKKEEA